MDVGIREHPGLVLASHLSTVTAARRSYWSKLASCDHLRMLRLCLLVAGCATRAHFRGTIEHRCGHLILRSAPEQLVEILVGLAAA